MTNCCYPFSLPPLPYDINSLSGKISPETLYYHHDKHFAKYVANLNEALAPYKEYQSRSLEELISHSYALPYELQQKINQSGGGVYNHALYFESLSPTPLAPGKLIAKAAACSFGSTETLISEFRKKAANLFGSGYCALCCDNRHRLVILTVPNQCTPLPINLYPLILCDLWEHAYYLDYKNDRATYITAFMELFNWETAEARFLNAISCKFNSDCR